MKHLKTKINIYGKRTRQKKGAKETKEGKGS